jgi:hypothetical protein
MKTGALTYARRPATSAAGPAKNRYLKRQCSCGQHTIGGATCDACKAKRGSLLAPGKSLGEQPDDHGEEKPRPRQGAASIQCDGSGGWEITYGSFAAAGCGTKDCVTAHESSHVADWQAKWPNGCTGQAKGYLPKGDPPDNPLMSASEYKSFLKDSECRAHTADLQCAKNLPKTGGCKQTVEDYVDLTSKQKDQACGSSVAARIILGLIGGAIGAGIGNYLGGGLGAAIGAGAGAGGGALLGGLF